MTSISHLLTERKEKKEMDRRMKKQILIGLLIAVMLLVLTGCGEKDTHGIPENGETNPTAASGKEDTDKDETGKEDTGKDDAGEADNSDANDSDADDVEDNNVEDNDVAYKFPAGASSEYELYKTVLAYLNNGFHSDDLKTVCDPVLTMVFFSKWEEKEDKIFTLGMQYDEACDLIARLSAKAAQMNAPYDEYGELEEDLIDFDAFEGEFPEGMRGQIEQNRRDFENFIVDIFYMESDFFHDGENPFYTDPTEWEVKQEGEYEVKEYHSNDWCDDLYDTFPKVYEVSLGTYIDYEATEMWFYYTQIDGRYYMLSFGYAVSGIGG